MSEDNGEKSNLERLLGYLPEDSVAARLVKARIGAEEGKSVAALNSVVRGVYGTLKEEYGRTED